MFMNMTTDIFKITDIRVNVTHRNESMQIQSVVENRNQSVSYKTFLLTSVFADFK